MRKNIMNAKNFMVFFVAIVMALFVVATVSAATPFGTIDEVRVDGILANNSVVTAGEMVTIKIYLTSNVNDSDVEITAELKYNGEKSEVSVDSLVFEIGDSRRIPLSLKVPYELKDELADETAELTITVEGDDCETEEVYTLKVERPSYNVDFKSINVAKNVESGKTFPVDILVKNTGYNDLEDLFVTARISALGIEESFYFGDLVSDEWTYNSDDDETDTLSKRIYLTVPYDAVTGTYTLEVEVLDEDGNVIGNKVKPIEVTNNFPERVIVSGNDLILVNPTDNIVGYRVVAESPASVSDEVVLVSAGSSETVTVTPNAEGEYSFDVNVFTMDGKVVSTVTFSGSEAENPIQSPIVILTVVLAIVFLVLLVVLIVLITKKPEKTDEFGESYY